jgi:hypothetical protein
LRAILEAASKSKNSTASFGILPAVSAESSKPRVAPAIEPLPPILLTVAVPNSTGCWIFLKTAGAFPRRNIVTNPPFTQCDRFVHRALELGSDKVAMIWLARRLNAARWLADTPLARVYLLTPRPSMPPGHVILAGEKPSGGTQDFCWLVIERSHVGPPELRWLHREPRRGRI